MNIPTFKWLKCLRQAVLHSLPGALLVFIFLLISYRSFAQNDVAVSARIDARKIMVGDQARVFIEAKTKPSGPRIEWAAIPDTFNNLEVVEKGKIDTVKGNGIITYRQRLLITGFDSGIFKIPALVFPVIPDKGTPYTVQTDSFALTVLTVPVDTTKAFKGIKGILLVKSTWRDYIWYIAGGILLLLIIVFIVVYFVKKNRSGQPRIPIATETLQEKTLRQLSELNARGLWQKDQVKQYYVELTDILRNYIELRFHTPALELTTDELLYKVQLHKELQSYYSILASILNTADLAKFAKALPRPQEHITAMEQSIQLIENTKPVIVTEPSMDKAI